MSKTAILIDGGFYRKRFEKGLPHSPKEAADALFHYCFRHLEEPHTQHKLYRIFYYDAPPAEKKIFHPLCNRTIDFSKTDYAKWMKAFLAELTHKRKVAIRLGSIDESTAVYTLTSTATKDIVTGKRKLEDLTNNDFRISIKQKIVDMKIGMDIASLSYKQQVDQIVLIAGDADFVPAAKLARREGIDFILDPLGAPIKDVLFEHIDGKRSRGNPYRKEKTTEDLKVHEE